MPQLTFCLEIEKGCDVISRCRSETIEPFQKKIKKRKGWVIKSCVCYRYVRSNFIYDDVIYGIAGGQCLAK